MTDVVLAIFVATYIGMATGRIPGLKVDRTGIALIAAVALLAIEAITPIEAAGFIDLPTMMLLFGLMIVAAQFGVAGVFDGVARRIAATADRPNRLLAAVIATSGVMSAWLTNDIVVFAMTPLLCAGLKARGANPVPYLIALAASANAGSATTLIGNPQNILIGQMTGLGFWHYLAIALPVAIAALLIAYGVIAWLWRGRLTVPNLPQHPHVGTTALYSDRLQFVKAMIATAALLILFMTPVPREVSTLAVAGILLASRRIASRRLVGAVDWNLLILFAGLFVVTGTAVAALGGSDLAARLASAGWLPDRLHVLAPLALTVSNTIGNVPAVILILQAWPSPPMGAMAALALLSTLAGNLLITGSLANIIVAERAQAAGVHLGFAEHARAGIPITLLSFAVAVIWLWGLGLLPP
ncbi:MAG TPA: SLC13 family permease [Alphaproteobacteria bacterium]|jgi:Na+/H+ antiporter NhaD/arsenite permease-like protein|nr:SLC13 family permease [Alphaproteobacteria bacterium]